MIVENPLLERLYWPKFLEIFFKGTLQRRDEVERNDSFYPSLSVHPNSLLTKVDFILRFHEESSLPDSTDAAGALV